MKKGVLRNFEKFTGKHLCQSVFLKKFQAYLWTTASEKKLASPDVPWSVTMISEKVIEILAVLAKFLFSCSSNII